MKKIGLLYLLVAILCFVDAWGQASFSSVAQSGQTLYYKLISDDAVELVCKTAFKYIEYRAEFSYDFHNPGYGPESYEDEEYFWVSAAYKPKGDVVIPDSVEYDGHWYRVTRIGQFAFMYCDSVTSLHIPHSVTEIDKCAFTRKQNIDTLFIPNSVTQIHDSAFLRNTSFRHFEVEEGNPSYVSVDGMVLASNGSYLLHFPANKGGVVTLPKYIRNGVFTYCNSVTGFVIPSDCVIFGLGPIYMPNEEQLPGDDCSQAYDHGLKALRDIYYQGDADSWVRSDCKAFVRFGQLHNLYVNDSMTVTSYIYNEGWERITSALSRCRSLEEITFPSTTTEIEKGYYPDLRCARFKCTTPPSLSYHREFNGPEESYGLGTNLNIEIHVPAGCANAYRNSTTWGRYRKIIEEPLAVEDAEQESLQVVVSNGNILVMGVPGMEVAVYDVRGCRVFSQQSHGENLSVPNLRSGIYIVRVGDHLAQKVVVVR